MYVSISEVRLAGAAPSESNVLAQQRAIHADMLSKPGFRWAMLLRSLDEPETLTAVTMWLSQAQALVIPKGIDAATGEPLLTLEYDVATARGSMTPASFVALVDWEVDSASAKQFTDRWNAGYHAIEDKLGSRLLQRLNAPGIYTGLHGSQTEDDLDARILGAPVSDGETMTLEPSELERFQVLLLTES